MSEEIVQIIVFVLIGVGWAVVNIIKKIDAWIQKNRLPRTPVEGKARETASAHPRTFAEQIRQQRTGEGGQGQDQASRESERPREARRSILEEIAMALDGLDRPEPQEAPKPVAAPVQEKSVRREAAEQKPQRQKPTQKMPSSGHSDGTVEGLGGLGARIGGMRDPRTADSTARGAISGARAFLRSQDDLRRGIILQEILGKPVALRESHLTDRAQI